MKTASPELDDMLQRIEKLEKQNRRFKVVGTLGVILAGALLIMGQASTQNRIIEAQGFVLVDGKGKRRAELSTSLVALGDVITGQKSDPAGLVFFDADGVNRVQLSLSDHGPMLRLKHQKLSLNGASLSVEANGTPELSLHGENGDMHVYASPTSTELQLTSKQPVQTLRLGSSGLSATSAGGQISLGVWDMRPRLALDAGKGSVRLRYSDNDEPQLIFGGVVNGKPAALAGIGVAENSGMPGAFVSDKQGNLRAALATLADGKPALYFYDEKGEAVQRYTVDKPQ